MQHRHHPDISENFHSKRVDSNLILVLNSDNYVMAEYRPLTGKTTWQRVVNVTQRERVEKWLAENYATKPVPAPKALPAAPVLKRKAKK
jgi:hypothetical protein